MYMRDSQIPAYARMIYNGFWFAPERKLLQNSIDEGQKMVNGSVRLKLYKGNCFITGRKAEKSLYHEEIASFDQDGEYSQNDAEGFIRLNALRLKLFSEAYGKDFLK